MLRQTRDYTLLPLPSALICSVNPDILLRELRIELSLSE